MESSSEQRGAPNGEPSEEIRIVLGVARLGEMGLREWWRSHGLNQAGRYVLGTAFPRTWLATGLELGFPEGEVCRIDVVPSSTGPVFVRTEKNEADLYVRLNKSTRRLNTAEALQ